MVINERDGPTTKADNLNAMWRALLADEAAEGVPVVAVALHDAEDVVHSAEIGVYRALCGRFDLVQLPVFALIERGSGMWRRFVSAVSADEFAESHQKAMVVREAVGAGVPSAGVGCGLSRAFLERIGATGEPFDASTVTEDYEIGLRVREMGGRGVFVRIAAGDGGGLVAVRAHFPDTVRAAVRQKTRWQAGIALSGWQRLGWRGGWAERWMRFRDRRAILASLILTCGYAAFGLSLALAAVGAPVRFGPAEVLLLDALHRIDGVAAGDARAVRRTNLWADGGARFASARFARQPDRDCGGTPGAHRLSATCPRGPAALGQDGP